MNILGVADSERAATVPDIPTIAESGLPGFDVSSWYGLFAPAKTPPELIAKISADAATVVREASFVDRLSRIATTAVGSTPEELARHLKSEMDKWAPVIKKTGARID